jgi:hypothetical protein
VARSVSATKAPASAQPAPGQSAAIEAVRTFGRDLLKRIGKIGLNDRMPDRRRGAVGEERDGAAPVGAQGREVLAGEMAVMRRRAKSLTGQPDRLGAKFSPGQPSIFVVHHAEPGEHAGHRHREGAGARNAAGVALGGRGKRRRAGAVEHDGAAALRVEHIVEGVAAEPRHHRLDDAERERCRDRGVDSIAAGAQRHEPGLRCQGIVRRDSAAPPDDQRPITADVLVHAGSVGWPNNHTLPQRMRRARKDAMAAKRLKRLRGLCVSIAAFALKRYFPGD